MEGVRQMFDGVIFDMDGLMVDTEPVWGECWEPALAHFGYSVPPGIADAVRGSAGDTATRILHEMVSPQLDTKAFWAYFSSLAEKVFSQGVEKKLGLDELLACLGERGVPCAVALVILEGGHRSQPALYWRHRPFPGHCPHERGLSRKAGPRYLP